MKVERLVLKDGDYDRQNIAGLFLSYGVKFLQNAMILTPAVQRVPTGGAGFAWPCRDCV